MYVYIYVYTRWRFHYFCFISGSITHTLQDLANVMVDVTVPARERRHAILPEINPIRKTKPSKQKGIIRSNNEKVSAESTHQLEENEEKTAGGKLLSLNNKFKTIFNTLGQKQESPDVEKLHEPESPLLDGTQKVKKPFEESEGNSPCQRKKKSLEGTENVTTNFRTRRRGLSELELKPPGHNSFSGQTFLDAGSPALKKSTCIPNNMVINEGRSHTSNSYHENAPPVKARRRAAIINSIEEKRGHTDENRNSFHLPNQTIMVNNSHVPNSFPDYGEEPPVSHSFHENNDQCEDEINERCKKPKVHYESRENLPPSLNTEDRAIFNPLLLTECV